MSIIFSAQAKHLHLGAKLQNTTACLSTLAQDIMVQKKLYFSLGSFLERQAELRDSSNNKLGISFERLKQLKFTLVAMNEAIELMTTEYEEYGKLYQKLDAELQRVEALARVYARTKKTALPKQIRKRK